MACWMLPTSSGIESDPVMKSETAKNASWFISPDSGW